MSWFSMAGYTLETQTKFNLEESFAQILNDFEFNVLELLIPAMIWGVFTPQSCKFVSRVKALRPVIADFLDIRLIRVKTVPLDCPDSSEPTDLMLHDGEVTHGLYMALLIINCQRLFCSLECI